MIETRLVVAFAIAPAVPALLLALGNLWSWPPEVDWLVGVNIALVPIAYMLAALFGIPLHLYLRKRQIIGAWVYGLAGAALGLSPALLMLTSNPGIAVLVAVVGVPYGILSGICFWLIAVCTRRTAHEV